MNIKLTEHALEKIEQRGTTKSEIIKTMLDGVEIPAKKGRKAKELVFDYGKDWLEKIYPQKKVVAIYVEEDEEIVVITSKVYYGKWN